MVWSLKFCRIIVSMCGESVCVCVVFNVQCQMCRKVQRSLNKKSPAKKNPNKSTRKRCHELNFFNNNNRYTDTNSISPSYTPHTYLHSSSSGDSGGGGSGSESKFWQRRFKAKASKIPLLNTIYYLNRLDSVNFTVDRGEHYAEFQPFFSISSSEMYTQTPSTRIKSNNKRCRQF